MTSRRFQERGSMKTKKDPFRTELRLSQLTRIYVGDHEFFVKDGDYVDSNQEVVQFTDSETGDFIEVPWASITVFVGRPKS